MTLAQFLSHLRFLIPPVVLLLGACSSPYKAATQHSVRSDSDPVKAHEVVDLAQAMVGKPYKYGGKSPRTGFDCSGLVYYTHKSLGRTLPRTSHAQYRSTQPVRRDDLIPGDLVFFRIHRSRVSHVGIYLGDDRFVHAPSSGKRVRINSLENPYWDKRFVRGGRVF